MGELLARRRGVWQACDGRRKLFIHFFDETEASAGMGKDRVFTPGKGGKVICRTLSLSDDVDDNDVCISFFIYVWCIILSFFSILVIIIGSLHIN